MFGRKDEAASKASAPAPISAYEDVSQRASQWWANEGVYMGFEVAPPDDPEHPLRGQWTCTGATRNYRGDRHILTVGPNGSGKTRRLLFPNLYYLKNWSIAAIDPKGELFAHTVLERAKTTKIVLLDPFGVVEKTYPHLAARFPCQSHGFNPVATLVPKLADGRDNPRFVDDAKALAVALIKTEGLHDKYWSQAAQALIKGVLMGLRLEWGEAASLALLRQVIGAQPATLAKKLGLMVANYGAACPALGASLSEFTAYSPEDRELGGIRRQAKVQTDWLDSAPMAADLDAGAYDFASIKRTPTTIYLVLPPEYLASHGTWLRLMVTAILRPLLREVDAASDTPPVPVLFMLDEFAQLGKMEIIEDNYALMRGYGVKLWTIWQDLNQAKILYEDRWESFIANAGIVQSFAPQDMTTRKYLSELADDRLTWHDVETSSGSGGMALKSMSSSASISKTHISEPLAYPYELGQMRQGWSVVFTQRGEMHRRYFPDATHEAFGGVAAMMAEAAKNLAP